MIAELTATLLQYVHFPMLLLGSAAYLGFSALPLTLPLPRRKEEDHSDCPQPPRPRSRAAAASRGSTGRALGSAACLALAACAVYVQAPPEGELAGCLAAPEGAAAADRDETPGRLPPAEANAGSPQDLPSRLLQIAHHALDGSADEEDRTMAEDALRSCVQWSGIGSDESDAPHLASELYAQLRCHSLAVLARGQDVAALVASGQALVKKVEQRAYGNPKAFGVISSVQAEWARITQAGLSARCASVCQELAQTRKTVQTLPAWQVVSTLRSARELQSPFEDQLEATGQGLRDLEALEAEGFSTASDDLTELVAGRAKARVCMLQAVKEARLLAGALPLDSAQLAEALKCPELSFDSLEALALQEGAKEHDPGAASGLGEYWSEVAVAEGPVPLFSTGASSRWVADSSANRGYVPEDVIKSELLLRDAEERSEGKVRGERGAMRALRLYHHAKFLVRQQLDSAAELRYRLSASTAAGYRRKKLAAHSLARLGYFLVVRGRQEEALGAVLESQGFHRDPLAVYLGATLRRSSGVLQSTEEVEAARAEIASVSGKLPSQALERQRAEAHAELEWWAHASEGPIWRCFQAPNVAHGLICILCRILFWHPDPAVPILTEEA